MTDGSALGTRLHLVISYTKWKWWILILHVRHCQLLIVEHSDQSFSVVFLFLIQNFFV